MDDDTKDDKNTQGASCSGTDKPEGDKCEGKPEGEACKGEGSSCTGTTPEKPVTPAAE